MIQIVYALFMAVWRRWFGGGFQKLGDNRFLQHIIGFTGASLILWYNGYHWAQVIMAAAVLQGLFWARSHGCCFDYGHGQPPDVSRYEQLWYWKYVKKIIPESEWYSFSGDYILMTVRYTLPAILIALVLLNPTFSVAGVVLSGVYAFTWKLYDWGLIEAPTDKAEYLAGFMTGLLLF